MCIEEHQHPQVPKVAFSEPFAVKTVNLRVGQDVTNSLKIDDHQIALSDLPREVTQALRNQRLICILAASPPSIVVVLLILAFDKVLSIVVLEGSIFIKDLVDERVNELYQVFAIDKSD